MAKSSCDESAFTHSLLDQVNLPWTILWRGRLSGPYALLQRCELRAHRDGDFTVLLRSTAAPLCSCLKEPEPPPPHTTSHCLAVMMLGLESRKHQVS